MAEYSIVPLERIQNCIYLVRGLKVMLSNDLAELYGVPVKALIQAVKRNAERFPVDFAFQLMPEEFAALWSQFVTLDAGRGQHPKYRPYAFTEQGVAMLSSVLRSPRAVKVNIETMRTFVQLRQLMATHTDLARKLEEMEKKYDAQFRAVFEAIRRYLAEPTGAPKQIGFHVREQRAVYRTGRNGR